MLMRSWQSLQDGVVQDLVYIHPNYFPQTRRPRSAGSVPVRRHAVRSNGHAGRILRRVSDRPDERPDERVHRA